MGRTGEDRFINRIEAERAKFRERTGQEAMGVRFTSDALEALWADLCGGNEDMLRRVPKIREGAIVWGFTVHLDDSLDNPNGFTVGLT